MDFYCSSDVEADGPLFGVNSMLSFGCAVYNIEKDLLGTFSRNLNLIEGGEQNPTTMQFWEKNQAAYDITRVDTVDPVDAMNDFRDWIKSFNGTPVFMGFPAMYDFGWINYYLLRYAGESPFGHSRCIDLKSVAYSMLKPKRFGESAKRNFPKRWFDDFPHTHVAIDDAIEQGAMGINILRELHDLPKK